MPDQPIVDRYMSRHVHNYPGSFSEEWDNSSIASLLQKCLCQAIEQQPNHANLDHGLAIDGQPFIVPAMPTVIE